MKQGEKKKKNIRSYLKSSSGQTRKNWRIRMRSDAREYMRSCYINTNEQVSQSKRERRASTKEHQLMNTEE